MNLDRITKSRIGERAKLYSIWERNHYILGEHQRRATTPSTTKSLGSPRTLHKMICRKAYRNGAIKNHPDKGGDAEKFNELAQAYQVLIDPEKRERYDQYGEDALTEGVGAVSGGHKRKLLKKYTEMDESNTHAFPGANKANKRSAEEQRASSEADPSAGYESLVPAKNTVVTTDSDSYEGDAQSSDDASDEEDEPVAVATTAASAKPIELSSSEHNSSPDEDVEAGNSEGMVEEPEAIVPVDEEPQLMVPANEEAHQIFDGHADVWHMIASRLPARSAVRLGATSRWFYEIILRDEQMWRRRTLRRLHLPRNLDMKVSYPWLHAYRCASCPINLFGNRFIGGGRIGGFWVTSGTLIFRPRMDPFVADRNNGFSAEPEFPGELVLVIPNTRLGLWVADVAEILCDCERPGCNGHRNISVMILRHMDYFPRPLQVPGGPIEGLYLGQVVDQTLRQSLIQLQITAEEDQEYYISAAFLDRDRLAHKDSRRICSAPYYGPPPDDILNGESGIGWRSPLDEGTMHMAWEAAEEIAERSGQELVVNPVTLRVVVRRAVCSARGDVVAIIVRQYHAFQVLDGHDQ